MKRRYIMGHVAILRVNKGNKNSALLWQKEASDIPSKSELLMFSYFT